jgi:hypothetical protein
VEIPHIKQTESEKEEKKPKCRGTVEWGHNQGVQNQQLPYWWQMQGFVREQQHPDGLAPWLRTSLIETVALAQKQSGSEADSEADRQPSWHNLPLAIRISPRNYFQQYGTRSTANVRNSEASKRLIKQGRHINFIEAAFSPESGRSRSYNKIKLTSTLKYTLAAKFCFRVPVNQKCLGSLNKH